MPYHENILCTKKNGIAPCNRNVQYLFKILSHRNAALLWKKCGISTVSQLADCSEQHLKVVSDSVPPLSALTETLSVNIHMDKSVD